MDAWTATERLQEAEYSVRSRSHENGISLVIMVTCDVIFASALNVTISLLQWHTSCKNEISGRGSNACIFNIGLLGYMSLFLCVPTGLV